MKAKPYGLMSDQHGHDWSQFSTKLPGGMNSRLKTTCDEIRRCAIETDAAGGDTIIFGGDLFHARGSINPEVFNPIAETIGALIEIGFKFGAIPGNHDLKTNETTTLGNAIQSLGERVGFDVITTPAPYACGGNTLLMVPWISKLDVLKSTLEGFAGTSDARVTDVIMHAGIDGVLSGVPAHGLTPAYLAGLGFRRVFSGHYHHHCTFESGKVVSIGATTHKDFGDIGTRAGFLIVHPDRIDYRASHAPSFVEINDETDADEIPLIVDGNFVRVRGFTLNDAQINTMRREILDLGAKGVTFQCERETVTARSGSVAAKGVTLEKSVDSFIGRMASPHEAAIRARAAQIIADARATAE